MRPSTMPPPSLTEELDRLRTRLGGYVAVHLRTGGGRYIQLKMRTDPSARVKTDGRWNEVDSRDQRKTDRRELRGATFAVRLVRGRKGRVRTAPVLHVWLTPRCDRVGLMRALQSIA
jgi:hypothetical protein